MKTPDEREIISVIDAGFRRWEISWVFDRYIPNSIRVMNRHYDEGEYITEGEFNFYRDQVTHTIPFSAHFIPSNDDFILTKLCYNDLTSGKSQIDCVDPAETDTAEEIIDEFNEFLEEREEHEAQRREEERYKSFYRNW